MTKNSKKDSLSVMQLFAFGTMTTLAGSQTVALGIETCLS